MADGTGICWLASFPKSGNTWTRILLSNLTAPDDLEQDAFVSLNGSISSNRPSFDSIAGLPSSDLTDDEIDLLRPEIYREMARTASKQLFTKVHDAFHLNTYGESIFPKDCSKGAIYLVRHPYDVAVSYAKHQGHSSFDKIIKQMNNTDHAMAGGNKSQLRQITSGWSGHFLSWHEQDAMPVLTLRYEDMLEDTKACLLRMIDFLGLGTEYTDAEVTYAVEASRFEKLQQREAKIGFRERPERAESFFRSGRSGEGREVLTRSQRDAIATTHKLVMDRLGYEP
ncbi:MAG: sulfotransferase domain-containing protein [Pseudomonadota bacterium]